MLLLAADDDAGAGAGADAGADADADADGRCTQIWRTQRPSTSADTWAPRMCIETPAPSSRQPMYRMLTITADL